MKLVIRVEKNARLDLGTNHMTKKMIKSFISLVQVSN